MIRQSALFLAVIACASRAAFAQSSDATNGSASPQLLLGASLDHVRANYPTVKAALQDQVAADRNVDLAKTAYLPQVNLLYQINRATINNVTGLLLPQAVIPAISGPVLPETGRSAWNSGAGALVSWQPFDFGYRGAQVDAAREAAAAAQAGAKLTEVDVLDATVNAYLNVVAASRLVATAAANVERLKSLANAVHVLVTNKLRAGVEGEQADAATGLAQSAYLNATRNLDLQRATLAKLLGRSRDDLNISGDKLLSNLPVAPFEAGGDLQSHPAAAQEQARVRQQAANLRATTRSYAPEVALVASASTRGAGKTAAGDYPGGSAGLDLNTTNWAAGVQVTFALGSLPTVRAKAAAQRATLAAERFRYDQTLADLSERLDQARTNLATARALARLTPASLDAARAAQQQQRARFVSSIASITDVTTTTAALAQAESEDAIARINVWRALADLAAAQGDMTPFRALVADR